MGMIQKGLCTPLEERASTQQRLPKQQSGFQMRSMPACRPPCHSRGYKKTAAIAPRAAISHHPGAGLSALIQQCLASVLLPALVGPGGVGLSHRPVMSLPLAQQLQVARLQPLQVPSFAYGLRPE